MEKKSLKVKCPVHKKENITRIEPLEGKDKEVYCLECLIESADPQALGKRLLPIEKFIDMVSNIYETRSISVEKVPLPKEFVDICNTKASVLESLRETIEKDKVTIENAFDEITKLVAGVIEKKKAEVIEKHNKQLENMEAWFDLLEKQISKAYPENPKENCPTKEELIQKLNDLNEISLFIEEIKQMKQNLDLESELKKKDPIKSNEDMINRTIKKITAFSNSLPSLKTELSNFEEQFNNFLEVNLKQSLTISNQILTPQKKTQFFFEKNAKVTVRSFSTNKYVSSENGLSHMTCNKDTANEWEIFEAIQMTDDTYAFKGNNGKHVCSENGGSPMNCNRDAILPWEIFKVVYDYETSSFTLIGNNGCFISSENGERAMTCSKSEVKDSERFYIELIW